MLRIHRHYFSRADIEQLRIEARNVVDEIGGVDVGTAPCVGVRVIIRADIPTARGHLARRAPPIAQQLPKFFNGCDPTREAATHSHNCDRLAPLSLQ